MTDYKKFNDAMCRLRQAEEAFHTALQDVYYILNVTAEQVADDGSNEDEDDS